MIITFCGHSKFYDSKEIHGEMMALLEQLVGDAPVEFFLGGYGNFDSFARSCCEEFKETHPNAKLILITPYINKKFYEYEKKLYDGIIYPEIEDKPLKFAISYRNKWMVEKADYVIAYVDEAYGGAYQTLTHARRRKKPIFNLSGKEI